MEIRLKAQQKRIAKQIKHLNAVNKGIEQQTASCNEERHKFFEEKAKMIALEKQKVALEHEIERLTKMMHSCSNLIQETKEHKQGVYVSALEHYYNFSCQRDEQDKLLRETMNLLHQQTINFNLANKKCNDAENALIDLLVFASDSATELGIALNMDFGKEYYSNMQIMKTRQAGTDLVFESPEYIEIIEDEDSAEWKD